MKKFIYQRTYSILFQLIVVSLCACLSCVIPRSATGQSTHQYLTGREYIVSDATVTAQWDAVSAALAYEARLVSLHHAPVTFFALARIPASETSVTFSQPAAGHFEAQVRACKYADCHVDDSAHPENDLSRWVQSTLASDAQVDLLNDGIYVSMGWWIYWKLQPITDPII